MCIPKTVQSAPRAATAPDRTAAAPENPSIDSAQLLRGARRLVIRHNGAEYLLQVTRAGRLILTK